MVVGTQELASKLPRDFKFGVATSCYQIEGALREDGRGQSIWEPFCATPGRTFMGHDGEVACDHYHRYQTDVAMMAALGVHAYRFSTAWPRIIPDGSGDVNEMGLDFYDRLVDELLRYDIEPFLTLFHWDLPQALQERGGWYSRETVDAFERYADVVARRLGDRVTYWITHNEPWCSSWLGHGVGIHAPGLTDGAEGAIKAAHHILLSHGRAAGAVRGVTSGSKVGIAVDLYPACPATPDAGDLAAAVNFDGYRNRWFLDPLIKGQYPEDMTSLVAKLPAGYEADMEVIGSPLDFLGVNYYERKVIALDPASGEPAAVPQPQSEHTDGKRVVFPEGLGVILRRLRDEYPVPKYFVTENGAAYAEGPITQGLVPDERRREFLARHLAQVADSSSAGVPLGGYFVWSFMDNFEWAEGYQDDFRYGIVHVDFKSQERTVKESGEWYSALIASHASGSK